MSSKSVEKRDRQNAKRRLRNRAAKSTYRTAVKKFEAEIAAGDKAKAEAAMAEAAKLLDSVAGKGIIHKNNAARKKSALVTRYNKVKA